MSATKHLTRVDEAEQIELGPGEYMTILHEGDAPPVAVLDATIPPHASPPRHHHPWATDELVIEGLRRAEVDGVTYELGPGHFLLTPAGAVHSFIDPGPESAGVIGMNVPSRRVQPWPGCRHGTRRTRSRGRTPDPGRGQRRCRCGGGVAEAFGCDF